MLYDYMTDLANEAKKARKRENDRRPVTNKNWRAFADGSASYEADNKMSDIYEAYNEYRNYENY